jgi:hypothetical protein
LAYGAGEDEGVGGDVEDLGSKCMEAYLGDIYFLDLYVSLLGVTQSEHGVEYRS